jgi:hypothetical protein
MPDLLPLGPGGVAMILLGFREGTRFMRRRHVGKVVFAAEFKGANVLDNPTLPYPIDLTIT